MNKKNIEKAFDHIFSTISFLSQSEFLHIETFCSQTASCFEMYLKKSRITALMVVCLSGNARDIIQHIPSSGKCHRDKHRFGPFLLVCISVERSQNDLYALCALNELAEEKKKKLRRNSRRKMVTYKQPNKERLCVDFSAHHCLSNILFSNHILQKIGFLSVRWIIDCSISSENFFGNLDGFVCCYWIIKIKRQREKEKKQRCNSYNFNIWSNSGSFIFIITIS